MDMINSEEIFIESGRLIFETIKYSFCGCRRQPDRDQVQRIAYENMPIQRTQEQVAEQGIGQGLDRDWAEAYKTTNLISENTARSILARSSEVHFTRDPFRLLIIYIK